MSHQSSRLWALLRDEYWDFISHPFYLLPPQPQNLLVGSLSMSFIFSLFIADFQAWYACKSRMSEYNVDVLTNRKQSWELVSPKIKKRHIDLYNELENHIIVKFKKVYIGFHGCYRICCYLLHVTFQCY